MSSSHEVSIASQIFFLPEMSVFLSSSYSLKIFSILLPNIVIIDRNIVAKVVCGPRQFWG